MTIYSPLQPQKNHPAMKLVTESNDAADVLAQRGSQKTVCEPEPLLSFPLSPNKNMTRKGME